MKLPFGLEFKPVARKWKILGAIVLVPVVLFTGWTEIALNWSYSAGERAGYVQKFSLKGWVCKTWEGELAMVSMPGTSPEKFYFTVTDEHLAERINGLMGKQVKLRYEQHKGLPTSCFGDTDYFVKDVLAVH